MVNTALRPDAGLAEILTARARGASDKRLATDLGAGLVVAAAVYVWRPTGWFFLLTAATCFAAYGAWGIADRELTDALLKADRVRPPVFRAIRVIAAVLGTVAAVALLCGVVKIFLGRSWTS